VFDRVAEIAEILKLNQQTVRNWIDQGSLPALRVGTRRVRVRRSDLDAYLERAANDRPVDATSAQRLARDRADLCAALDRARAAIADEDDAELSRALRELRGPADRILRAIAKASHNQPRHD
jgi:excisionase family DNA binding protein